MENIKIRYIIILMVFFGILVIYMMRININLVVIAVVNHTAVLQSNVTRSSECGSLNITIPPVTADPHELHTIEGEYLWDERVIGWIIGAFYYGYVFTQIPGGRLAETYGSKHVFGLAVLFSAIITLLTPLAIQWRWEAVVVLRAVMGFVNGVNFPAMFVLLRVWAPPSEMNFMAMFANSGAEIGSAFTLPMTSYIIETLGWEAVFYIQGGIALIWFAFWILLVYSTPDQHPFIGKKEKEYIKNSIGSRVTEVQAPPPWGKILTSRPVWTFCFTMFSANWCYYNLLNDLPQYVNNIMGESLNTNALINSFPYIGLWLHAVLFGSVCDWLLERKLVSVWLVRQMASATTQLFTAILLIIIAYSGCQATLVKVLLVITIILQGGTHCLYCQAIDLAPNYAGTLAGVSGTLIAMPGFLAPLVVSELTAGNDTIASWRIVFLIAAGISLVGWFVFLFFSSVEEQPWNQSECDDVKLPSYKLSIDAGIPTGKTV